jgi:hypothetical protein
VIWSEVLFIFGLKNALIFLNLTKEKGRYIFDDQRVENILPFPVMQSIVINPIQNT